MKILAKQEIPTRYCGWWHKINLKWETIINYYTPYLSVFSLNAGKYWREKLRIRTLFKQCMYFIKHFSITSIILIKEYTWLCFGTNLSRKLLRNYTKRAYICRSRGKHSKVACLAEWTRIPMTSYINSVLYK